MIRYLRNPLVYLLPVAMLLAACASTQLKAVWKDPGYHDRPAKIMVIGIAKNPINRRLFEDEFVAQIKARGMDAIASYTVLPDKHQDDQEVIAAKVKESGVDTILITRLVSKKIVKTYVPATPYFPPSSAPYFPPPAYGSWMDYYGYGYNYMYTPGYIAEDEYGVIESNLYDAKSDKLVWASSSETGFVDSEVDIIHDYIDIIVMNMVGMLGK